MWYITAQTYCIRSSRSELAARVASSHLAWRARSSRSELRARVAICASTKARLKPCRKHTTHECWRRSRFDGTMRQGRPQEGGSRAKAPSRTLLRNPLACTDSWSIANGFCSAHERVFCGPGPSRTTSRTSSPNSRFLSPHNLHRKAIRTFPKTERTWNRSSEIHKRDTAAQLI